MKKQLGECVSPMFHWLADLLAGFFFNYLVLRELMYRMKVHEGEGVAQKVMLKTLMMIILRSTY